jgi:putative oxidoreductase
MRRVIPVNLDLALLILRVALAAVMLTHGLPKATGFSGTAGFFASAGIPAATLAAAFATVVEVLGGILMLLGVRVDIVGLLFALDMLGAITFVHFKNGWSGQGGFEFTFVLLCGALAVALAGAGRYAVGGAART